MSKDRIITDGKLPERVCPICRRQVRKAVIDSRLSYVCENPVQHWGPWDDAIKKELTRVL